MCVYLKSIVAVWFVIAIEIPFASGVADVSQIEIHALLTILGCHCSHPAHPQEPASHVQHLLSLSFSLSLSTCANKENPRGFSPAFNKERMEKHFSPSPT
jgi:hypothetical protein